MDSAVSLPALPDGFSVDANTALPALPDGFSVASGSQNAANPVANDYSPIGLAKSAISSLSGIRQGVLDPLNAGAQMLVHAMPDSVQNSANSLMGDFAPTATQFDEKLANNEKSYQSTRKDLGDSGFDLARMTGNIASTVPLSMALPALAPESLLGNAVTGAGYGAGYGALQPVTDGSDFISSKLKQMEVGAMTGGATSVGANVLGRIISPNISPEVKTLMDAGVTPTPGQIMGGSWKSAEDKLSSVPVLGDMINNSQRRSVQDFNTAIYNKALEPIGKTIDANAGREGVQAVKDTLKNSYDQLLPKLNFATDNQFNNEIGSIKNLAQFMPKQQAQQFNNVLQSKLYSRLSPTGMMDGQTFKGVESELGQTAKGYLSDSSYDNRQLGSALQEVLKSTRGALERSNPDFAPQLQNINQAYANYTILRNAASKVGAEDGVFTPAQFQNAVRAADTSAGKGNFATGNARFQDLSDAGKSVLGNKYPDSGTAGRALMGALGGMMVEGGGAALGHPLIPMAAATAAIPYTKAGQSAMATLLANRPDLARVIGSGMQQASPFIGAGTVPFALGGGF